MSKENRNAASDREVRTLTTARIELRAAGDGTVSVEGYAAIFDEETVIGDWFREVVRPGAFTEALSRRDDATFLINHDGLPLARVASRTLTLTEDKRGLKIATSLRTDDPDVARIIPKMERGDLNKMSFAFSIYPDGEQRWTQEGEQELELREIVRVGRLYDVSIVTDPAYAGTEIALRARDAARSGRPTLDGADRARRNMRLGLAARSAR